MHSRVEILHHLVKSIQLLQYIYFLNNCFVFTHRFQNSNLSAKVTFFIVTIYGRKIWHWQESIGNDKETYRFV